MAGSILDSTRSTLLLIDVQERLLPAMDDPAGVVSACAFLGQVAGQVGVPVVVTEQYPKGLGPTAPDLLAVLEKPRIVQKTAFSAAREDKVMDRLRKLRSDKRREQIVIAGIEAHVCVLQTALDLRQAGFEVFVAADATSSRRIGSRDLALSRMAHANIVPVSTEMVAFEWVGDASAPSFKAVSALIRAR